MAAQPGMTNMGQGYPDYAGSKIAREAASKALSDPSLNQYSAQIGLEKLRVEISRFYERFHKSKYDHNSEIVVTTSGQEALACIMQAFLNPGDEVIIFEPFYPFLLGAIRLSGATPKAVRLRSPDFEFTQDDLYSVLTNKTKAIIVNSPHNPTGHVLSAKELDMLVKFCNKNDLLALSDEVYENAVFPGREHVRLADMPGMRDRTITVSSGGKLFSLTGWRVAWATGPEALMSSLAYAHTNITYCAPAPLQAGIAAALAAESGDFTVEEDDGRKWRIRDLFAGNFELLSSALRQGAGLKICEAQGGYFLVAETDGMRDVDFCRKLAQEKGVVCTPLSPFYLNMQPEDTCKLVRFTICKSRSYIEEACRKIRRETKI